MAPTSETLYIASKARIAGLESRIENAASNDEGLQLAIEAAELALHAIKLAVSKPEQVEMKAKATSLLKQAETFKKENAPRTLPDRMRTSLSIETSNRASSSPSHALTAADRREYLRQLALSAISGEPARLESNAKRMISRREISKAEQVLLLRGSKLNNCKFPPWASTPNADDFVLPEGSLPYIDDHEMRLSDEQLEYLDAWKHATEAIPPPTWATENGSFMPISLARNLTNMDLVQDATTDCSVVASMCACIARASKGHPKVLGDLIYPWDNDTGKPILSPNGKYIVKLNFNGCWRRVVIDDRLPVSKTKRLLHVVDRRNPQLLWPALLEKAYLKVRGGYDFPGSNSGTDLWMLTGWIPEQIFLQDSDTDLSERWRTILQGWGQGNALITMGTGVISRKVERADGLASQHDYAVLDLFDDGEHQLVKLKNPWREGKSWTGKINGVNDLHNSDDVPNQREQSKKLQNLLAEDLPLGTFWIPWNDIQQHFESIYCNWNPHMFSHREDIHFSWDLRTERGAVGSFANNPQFSITTSGSGEIWILLCRHFQDASTGYSSDEQNISVDASGSMTGHINLYLYDDSGRRRYTSSLPCERGHYVDAPQVLCKASVDQAKAFTVVVSEQGLPDIRQNFSLTVFSKIPLELDFAKDAHAHTSTVKSAWTSSSAGGRSGSLTFYNNPMFTIQFDQPTSLAMLLSTPDSDPSVNLKLVHSSGKRIQALRSRDLIADSGDYRRGSAFAEAKMVDAGAYTIICSTFEASQKASFSLRVDSTQPVVVRQLPPQYAGRLSKRLPHVRFDQGISRLGMCIRPQRHAILSAAISGYTSPSRDYRTPIRLSIVINPGVNEQIMYVSNDGEYSDGRTSAVQLPEMNIWPKPGIREDMWLMLERMSGGNSQRDNHGAEEVYAVDVYCDDKVDWCVSMDGWRCFED